jgi:ribonuclease J
MDIRVTFLGGIGEIGKNMTLFEFDDEAILLDAGFRFPDAEMLGIDKLIPDFSYLLRVKNKIKGIILSHGHADHIGAMRYLLDKIEVPVYTTPLTFGILKADLPTYLSKKIKFMEVKLPSKHKIGSVEVNFIRVTHSIPDGFSTIFSTPYGSMVHSGDFKIDQTPIDNKPIDLQGLAEVGKNGVLLYLGDSTNANEDGFTGSERIVGGTLENLIRGASGRVLIATFSTNLHRVQQVLAIARKLERKVLIDGKSIIEVLNVASKQGYEGIPENLTVNYNTLQKFKDKEVLILTTGTQGEPFSGLTKLANESHEMLKIKKGDLVIISADPIPGNEGLVSKVIDGLFKLGAEVIYGGGNVHVSGHGAKEDLRTMFSLLKPKFFIPVHGEYRQMYSHVKIATETNVEPKNALIVENGSVVSVTNSRIKVVERVPAEPTMIDGKIVGDVEFSVVYDRRRLSKEGVVSAVYLIGRQSRKLIIDPIIETKGFISNRFSGKVLTAIKADSKAVIEEWAKNSENRKELELRLRKFLQGKILDETHRNPIIFVTVLEG